MVGGPHPRLSNMAASLLIRRSPGPPATTVAAAPRSRLRLCHYPSRASPDETESTVRLTTNITLSLQFRTVINITELESSESRNHLGNYFKINVYITCYIGTIRLHSYWFRFNGNLNHNIKYKPHNLP